MEKDPGVLPFKTVLSPFLLVRVPWVFRATDVIQLLKKKYLFRHSCFSAQAWLGRPSGLLVLWI